MRLKIFVFPLLLFPLLTALKTQNEDGKYEVEACDGETATLECPSSHVIVNITANYGRMSINSCNDANADFATNCLNFAETKAVLESQCNSSSTCTVQATQVLFGLPKTRDGESCVYREGAFFLSVIYHCQPTTTPSTTTVAAADVSIDNGDEEEEEEEIRTTTVVPPHHSARCPSQTVDGVRWNETERERRAVAKCPQGMEGNAVWSCLWNGTWSSSGPSFTGCSSKTVAHAINQISTSNTLKSTAGIDNAMKMLTKWSAEEATAGGDLSAILDLKRVITPILAPQSWVDEKRRDGYRKASLALVSSMIGSRSAWESGWTGEEKRGFAARYMKAIENILMTGREEKMMNGGNVRAELSTIPRDGSSRRIPSMNIGDSAILPSEIFGGQQAVTILFASTKGLGKYLPYVQRSPGTSRIVSNIVTISRVHDHSVEKVNLSKEKVDILFDHSSSPSISSYSNPRCVWWNGEIERGGDWSQSGCSLVSSNEKITVCRCDHLTHFAVLMDIGGMELSSTHTDILTLMTQIGCAISILSLILAFLAFVLFARHGGDRVFIHKNLCLTLALAQLLFVFTISRTENQMECRIISSLLLYSFLAALLWMFIEGVQLYFLLIDVFSSHSRRLKYSIFAYGLPLLVVGITNYVTPESMTTQKYCWLSPSSSALLFSFIIPSMVIMLSNAFFLSLAIWITLRRSSNGYMPCKYPSDTKPFAWIKGSLSLMFLLGLTWSLGFYFVYDATVVYVAYAFTVLNSLQGLFILLFHVVFNDKMRTEMSDWFSRRGCLSTTNSNDSTVRRSANAFSPSNESSALFIGGECSDSSMLPRGMYGMGPGGGGMPYLSHEEIMRQQYYQHQQYLAHQRRMEGAPIDNEGGQYDYATIAYGEMVGGGGGQYIARIPPPSAHLAYAPPPYLRYGCIPPPPVDQGMQHVAMYGGSVTRLHQPRLPPPQTVPPLPPSTSPPSRISPQSAIRAPPPPFRRPPSSDDSAYSDSSSMFTSEVTVDGSTVLRMNLGRNPLYQQDL